MCFKHYIRQKRGGSKMKILALWTKLNQISYTNSVGPQKARNAKTNHPKWGGRFKNENSSLFDLTQPNFVYIFCGPPEGLKYNN